MGLLPIANHLGLLRDCYPVKTLTTTPIADLKPDGNALSKLCFYSASRPKKLPKVAAAVLERAERDARTLSGGKARAGLAVTVDVARGLVSECRSELHCFALQALQVAELALGRREGGARDTAMEARGASLFHAVSVFTSGPSVGLDHALVQQYLRCLAILSSMAQLGKGSEASRWIALSALEGAVTSELLYAAAASDYGSQIRLIIPALLYNCVELPVPELRQKFNVSHADGQTANLGAVPSRKSPPIIAPNTPPTPSALASTAIDSLRTTVRLSQAVQLSTKLAATHEWLDRHNKGALWANEDVVQWIAESGVAATAVQYRAGVVNWWVDQVAEIDAATTEPKHQTLVEVLSSILRGPTSLVGLGIGTVLAQLTSLLVRRIPLGDQDPLRPRLLEAISGLASHVYYFDQLNDVVADLIETIRNIKSGSGPVASFSDDERSQALRVVVSALRGVIVEAQTASTAVQTAVPMNKTHFKGTVKPSPHTNGGDAPHRPPLPESDGTVRGNGVLLGVGQGLRSKKESVDSRESAALDAMGRPVMRVEEAGRRNRISPDVFHESLFLLTDDNVEARLEYQQALLLYITDELDVAITDSDSDGQRDPWRDSSKFFDELHTTAYELATSFISVPVAGRSSSPIILLRTPQRERTKSTSRKVPRSRQSSGASVRRSSSPPPIESLPVATAADYTSLSQILTAMQARKSSLAVVAAVPMLLALEQDVHQHVQANFSPEGSAVRVQACRELVANALGALGTAWGVSDVERIARTAVAELSPSVLAPPPVSSRSNFAADACKLPPPFETGSIVEPLAASQKLQAASGLDRTTLASGLAVPWTLDSARSRSQTPAQLYTSSLTANGAGRSYTNLSSLRISSGASRAHSIRTPSLADLQTSLGRPGTAGSVHTSGTPSIASTSGTVATMETTRRRTARSNAGSVLASLGTGGTRSGSRLSVARSSSGRLVNAAQNAAARFVTA